MSIEKIKENLLNQILEVESDMKILSERISVLKSEIPKAETEEEIDRITFDNDLEEGLIHIRIFLMEVSERVIIGKPLKKMDYRR